MEIKLLFFKRQADFDYISYSKINFKNTRNNLIKQLKMIKNIQTRTKAKIIVVSPPILSNAQDKIKINKLIKTLKRKKKYLKILFGCRHLF